MIGGLFKNLWKNLIYLFIPMGILYFFFLITVFYLVGTVGGDLGKMIGDLAELIGSSTEQSNASVSQFLAYSFELIDWRNPNPFATLRQILDTHWLQDTIKGFLMELNASSEGFEEQFGKIIAEFHGKLTTAVSVAASLCVVGVLIANFATRYAIRQRTAKRNWKQTLLAYTVVPIIQSVVLFLFLVLLSFINLYSVLVVPALLAIAGVISLLSSWLIHRKGDLRLRDVLTVKNVFKHLAVIGIVFLIDLGLAALFFMIDPLLALLLILPVVLYTFNVADLNTESYVWKVSEQSVAAKQAVQRAAEVLAAQEGADAQAQAGAAAETGTDGEAAAEETAQADAQPPHEEETERENG